MMVEAHQETTKINVWKAQNNPEARVGLVLQVTEVLEAKVGIQKVSNVTEVEVRRAEAGRNQKVQDQGPGLGQQEKAGVDLKGDHAVEVIDVRGLDQEKGEIGDTAGVEAALGDQGPDLIDVKAEIEDVVVIVEIGGA